jgi:hypothetical protein
MSEDYKGELEDMEAGDTTTINDYEIECLEE